MVLKGHPVAVHSHGTKRQSCAVPMATICWHRRAAIGEFEPEAIWAPNVWKRETF
jgi:hypothetical protein